MTDFAKKLYAEATNPERIAQNVAAHMVNIKEDAEAAIEHCAVGIIYHIPMLEFINMDFIEKLEAAINAEGFTIGDPKMNEEFYEVHIPILFEENVFGRKPTPKEFLDALLKQM